MSGEQLRTDVSRKVVKDAERNVQSDAGECIELDRSKDVNEGINNGRTWNETQKNVQILAGVGKNRLENGVGEDRRFT